MHRRGKYVAVVVGAALGVAVAVPARAHVGSADTAALQVALRAHGLYPGTIDGVAGPGTRAAVRAFQRRAGLVADGVAGRRTRRALGRRGRPRLGVRPIRRGHVGWDVAALQWLLARQGFPSGPFDGALGPRTDVALRRFQLWAGLGADGIAGPATLRRLRRHAPRSPLRLVRPVAGRPSDRFGPRGNRFHGGVDYPLPAGASVWAAGHGCVAFAGWDPGGYGNLVVIGHRLGLTSWYAHLSSIAVRRGACVRAGAPIGRVGSTGFATGPHLHLELRLRGALVDPGSAIG